MHFALKVAREIGIDSERPSLSNTIFLKRYNHDAFVIMYHGQGQIALKILVFDRGITVKGEV